MEIWRRSGGRDGKRVVNLDPDGEGGTQNSIDLWLAQLGKE